MLNSALVVGKSTLISLNDKHLNVKLIKSGEWKESFKKVQYRK